MVTTILGQSRDWCSLHLIITNTYSNWSYWKKIEGWRVCIVASYLDECTSKPPTPNKIILFVYEVSHCVKYPAIFKFESDFEVVELGIQACKLL